MIVKGKRQKAKGKSLGGFTLIEMMVVIVLFALIGVLGVSFFTTILRGSSKTTAINAIKQNGSYAMGIMERFVRNAESVISTCEGSATLILRNPDGGETTFGVLSDRIASSSSWGGIDYLTSSDVKVTINSMRFTCSRAPGRPDNIVIEFTLERKPPIGVTLTQERKASVPFRTTVSLRNY